MEVSPKSRGPEAPSDVAVLTPEVSLLSITDVEDYVQKARHTSELWINPAKPSTVDVPPGMRYTATDVARFWRRKFAEEQLKSNNTGPEHTLPYRIYLAWRVARVVMRTDTEEFLVDFTPEQLHSRLQAPKPDQIAKSLKYLLELEGCNTNQTKIAYGRLFIHSHWPSLPEILYFEEQLVLETFQKLLNTSVNHARTFLQSEYHLRPKETLQILSLAQLYSHNLSPANVEHNRSLMVHRLEDLLHRAKENMDTRTELQTLKQISSVQGLNKAEPEDELDSFTNVVKAVSTSFNTTEQRAALPAPSTEDDTQ